MPLYEVVVSGTAWVSTTYRVEAATPEEAEHMVRADGVECVDEEITDHQETYYDVTEIGPAGESRKTRSRRKGSR